MIHKKEKGACGYVSVRLKRIGKAVPTRATAAAPAIKYTVPSEETSPTAATTTDNDLLLLGRVTLLGDDDPHEEEGLDCFRKFIDVTNVVCNAGAIAMIPDIKNK